MHPAARSPALAFSATYAPPRAQRWTLRPKDASRNEQSYLERLMGPPATRSPRLDSPHKRVRGFVPPASTMCAGRAGLELEELGRLEAVRDR